MIRAPSGLYVPRAVALAEPTRGDLRTLAGQIATRERSWDAWGLSSWLPNPDPILKGLGRDIEVYRDLRADGHVAGCIRRRKSAVLQLEPDLDRGPARARVHRDIETMLADLDTDIDPDGASTEPGLRRLIAEALDAALYGYQPIEVTWQRVGSYIAPVAVGGRPPEWFRYGADNRIRFRARDSGIEGELLPARKLIVARQEPSYANPYGLADLSLIFWPAAFRKAGGKFWTYFVEKYGGAFLVGKLPRSAKPGDYDDLTDRLAAMIQDAVAAIPDDGSVEIVEAAKAASTDAHERYLRYWRGEITIALLGSNQGMEMDSTRASAVAGLEVAEDIRDGDARLVEAAVQQLIRWTCELNGWGGAPTWTLHEQEEIDETQPRRDKTLTECGVRFTRSYWQRTYDLEDDDLAPEAEPPESVSASLSGSGFQAEVDSDADTDPDHETSATPALADTPDPDYAEQQAERLGAAAEPVIGRLLDPVRAELDRAISDGVDLAEFRERLLRVRPDLPNAALTDILGQAFAAATLAGMSSVDDEDTDR